MESSNTSRNGTGSWNSFFTLLTPDHCEFLFVARIAVEIISQGGSLIFYFPSFSAFSRDFFLFSWPAFSRDFLVGFQSLSDCQSKLVERKGCVTKYTQLTKISLVLFIVTSKKISLKLSNLSWSNALILEYQVYQIKPDIFLVVFEKNWLFIRERLSNSYCCPCETGLNCKVVENQSEIVAKSFILLGPGNCVILSKKSLFWILFFFAITISQKGYYNMGCVIETRSNL